MSWYDTEPRIAEVLRNHFPKTSQSDVNYWAKEIYSEWSFADSVQRIERSDVTSKRDIAELITAIRHLEKASKNIGRIGWHGGKTLQGTANKIPTKDYGPPGMQPYRSILEAPSVVSIMLRGIAEDLRTAVGEIPLDASPVNSAFGEGPEFERHVGTPTKTAAKYTAKICADAYQSLSGKKPTIIVDPIRKNNLAGGPYLQLVDDVFSILEITASPESAARMAVKEKTPKRK
jgi:hypothetical protein